MKLANLELTYTTDQLIVFVGTGQIYQDLCTLNVQAVVSHLHIRIFTRTGQFFHLSRI